MAGCQSDVDKTISWKSSQQKYDSSLWAVNKYRKKDAKYILWTFKNKTKNKSHLQELDCWSR